MPLVKIDLSGSTRHGTARRIADGVHQALVAAINIPPGDRFQMVTHHADDELIFDLSYLDVERRDIVYIQITLVGGRSQTQKLDLYRHIARNLSDAGVRPQDVFITLTANAPEDWSAGDGLAQLIGTPAPDK